MRNFYRLYLIKNASFPYPQTSLSTYAADTHRRYRYTCCVQSVRAAANIGRTETATSQIHYIITRYIGYASWQQSVIRPSALFRPSRNNFTNTFSTIAIDPIVFVRSLQSCKTKCMKRMNLSNVWSHWHTV